MRMGLMIGIAAMAALPAGALAQSTMSHPGGVNTAVPVGKAGGKQGNVQSIAPDGKPPKMNPGVAMNNVGGQASGVAVQQSSRLGVGGAAGEAGECCKPKEMGAAVNHAAAGPGGGPVASTARVAADDPDKKPPPKDPKSMATFNDGAVRMAEPNVAPAQVPQPH